MIRIKKKKLFCCFIDFEKAFDKVWREGVWYKLLMNKIDGKIYNIIINMYKGIKSRIQFKGEFSEYFLCQNGLRQGENLSPLLFSLYLNDIEQFFIQNNITGLECITRENENNLNIYLKLFILLYADDTVLMADNPEQLQREINIFSDYCKIWKLKVNTEKTKIVIFSKGRLPAYDFKINNEALEVVKEFNYLGVTFSRGGSFLNTIKNNAKKGTKAMYEILRKGRFHNLSISCQYHLFEKIVTPILLYGCEIWGSSNTEILEKVHLKFCKLLLNLKRSTPNYMVYGELGTYPLSTLIKQRIVNFWAKLVNANNSDKISAILYRFSYQKFDSGEFRSKWLLNVKDILDKNGLSYLFF